MLGIIIVATSSHLRHCQTRQTVCAMSALPENPKSTAVCSGRSTRESRSAGRIAEGSEVPPRYCVFCAVSNSVKDAVTGAMQSRVLPVYMDIYQMDEQRLREIEAEGHFWTEDPQSHGAMANDRGRWRKTGKVEQLPGELAKRYLSFQLAGGAYSNWKMYQYFLWAEPSHIVAEVKFKEKTRASGSKRQHQMSEDDVANMAMS
eukprot:scaffold182305_cov46-Prasinocladus_malaysianus.AAC.3